MKTTIQATAILAALALSAPGAPAVADTPSMSQPTTSQPSTSQPSKKPRLTIRVIERPRNGIGPIEGVPPEGCWFRVADAGQALRYTGKLFAVVIPTWKLDKNGNWVVDSYRIEWWVSCDAELDARG